MAIGNGFKCAMELILRTCLTGPLPTPVRLRSMSSRLLPWVSGTQNIMNTRPSKQIPPNIQKAPSEPKTRNKSAKVLVTTNVQAQLNAVASEAAVPLILAVEKKKKKKYCQTTEILSSSLFISYECFTRQYFTHH